MLFLCYPKCTTCQKARRYLQDRSIPFTERHIKDEPPTAAELASWQRSSGLPLKRFFNTSGMAYRSLNLKDRLPSMEPQELLDLLASDGMLVKRPILIGEDFVLVGFREKEWAEKLG